MDEDAKYLPMVVKMVVDIYNPKFSDVQEKSDEEFRIMIDIESTTRDFKRSGKDGLFTIWDQTYEYRGIKYQIRLMRYYQIGVPLNEIKGMNHLSKYFLLEHPPESDEFDNISYDGGEFLYADTLHSYNENQTLEEMFNEMVSRAESDIDRMLDQGIEKKIEELRKILNHIDVIRKHSEKYPKV